MSKRDEVIEAMAHAVGYATGHPVYLVEAIHDALRAAEAHGYVLAKLPEEKEETWEGHDRHAYSVMGEQEGWNACLDAIETIEIGDEQ
jgi:hypothetical protein